MSENEWESKLKDFYSYDQETKVAECILCDKKVSFENTIVNLIQHLALAHPGTFTGYFPIIISNEEESRDDDLETIKITCDFNSLFEIDQDTEIATCTLCHDNVLKSSTISHLKKDHVDVYNNFIVSASNVKNEDKVSEVGNCSDRVQNGSNGENSSEESNSNEKFLEIGESYISIAPDEKDPSKRPPKGRKCRTDIWKLFIRVGNSRRAKCKQCKKELSFKSTITNLKQHLRIKHLDLYNIYYKSPSTSQRNAISSPKLKKIERETLLNGIWDVYDRIEGTKQATCTLCQKVISYRSSVTNLKDHIKRKHPKVYDNFDLKTPRLEKLPSPTFWWKFYNRFPKTKKVSCKLCQKVLSFKNTTFNLKIHLQKEHPVVYHKNFTSSKLSCSSQNDLKEENDSEEEKELDRDNFEERFEDIPCSEQYSGLEGENGSQRGNDTEEENGLEETNFLQNNSKKRSKVWYFFTSHRNNEKATCTLCQQVMSYKSSITNLKVHIKLKHPFMYHKFFNSSKSASPPRIDCERQNGSKQNLKNKHINALKIFKTDSTSGKLHEVYIKTGEEKDQTMKEIVHDFDSEIDGVTEDSKHIDPFDDDEVIHVKQPLEKKQRLISTMNSASNIQRKEKKVIDRCLLKLITENFHPLSIIEDVSFREFVAALNPNYQLPNRKMLSNLLTEEFSSRVSKYNQITQRCSCISLTLDCWSSCNMQYFMAVTAHFIDQSSYEFSSVLINCAALHSQHTADEILSELLQATNEFDITDKIKFVVTDDTPNTISATRILKWPHFSCFARKFNLIVEEALNESPLADIVTKVQKYVAFIKRCSTAQEMLREYQVENQQDALPINLSLSIPTQWMTVYEMLKRCSELQLAIRDTVSNGCEENKCPLTSEEWECVDQMVEVLKPFVEAATMIASEKYLIAGKAVVLTSGLYKVVTALAERFDFHEPVTDLVLKLRNGLSTNFDDMETVEEIAICTLLDPRFKHHAFENQEALLNAKKCVIGKIERFNRESDSTKPASSSIVQAKSVTNTLFGHFYTKVESSCKPDNTDELNRYLSANVIPPTECPLMWWKERRNLYPALSKIFVDSFNIVVNSLPGDRIFSKSGNAILHRRSQLTTSKIDKIMYLNVNK